MLSKPDAVPPSMDASCRPLLRKQTLVLGSCLLRKVPSALSPQQAVSGTWATRAATAAASPPPGAASGTSIGRRQCLPGNAEEMIPESMTSRFIGNGCCISFLIALLNELVSGTGILKTLTLSVCDYLVKIWIQKLKLF